MAIDQSRTGSWAVAIGPGIPALARRAENDDTAFLESLKNISIKGVKMQDTRDVNEMLNKAAQSVKPAPIMTFPDNSHKAITPEEWAKNRIDIELDTVIPKINEALKQKPAFWNGTNWCISVSVEVNDKVPYLTELKKRYIDAGWKDVSITAESKDTVKLTLVVS